HLAEQLAHQVHPTHGLAPCALQLVLQLRVLEILQVQRRGVFHQVYAGGVGEQLGEQRIGVADDAAEQVRADRQPELQCQQSEQRIQQAARQRFAERRKTGVMLAELDRRIDDQ